MSGTLFAGGDRAHCEQELTLDVLRQKFAASRNSGDGSRGVDNIFAEAQNIARARGLLVD